MIMNYDVGFSITYILENVHQSRRWFYLISLFSKSDDEGGGGQKSQKFDDAFYEWPHT